jgi:hypothetical protein
MTRTFFGFTGSESVYNGMKHRLNVLPFGRICLQSISFFLFFSMTIVTNETTSIFL